MKRLFAGLLFASAALSAQQIYDVLLKNGRVIDPANRRESQVLDVAISGNRIVRVAPNLQASHAHAVIDVSGYIVAPGLIDINARFASTLKPDYNTLPYGVTTVVDAGSATCDTFADFKKEVIDHAKVRLLAILSPTNAECASRVARQNPETIVSVAAPDAGPLLFSRKSLPDTISSHMDWNSILVPRANLSTAMSIFLNLGMTPEQVIERVTFNAARAIKHTELGTLSEGAPADLAILEIQEGKFGFLDSALTRLDATRRFRCLLTIRNGVIVWDSDGLSITDTLKAGPYTNFK